MSSERRHANPGKRERAARKRHRRSEVSSYYDGSVAGPYKLGRKHLGRWFKASSERWIRETLAVAESEKTTKGRVGDQHVSSGAE